MTILILNKRPLRSTPYHKWIPDAQRNAVLFTSKANQTPECLMTARSQYREVVAFEHYDTTGHIELETQALHKKDPITAIIALSEVDLLRAAQLREHLGIRGQGIQSATAFRDKFIMKSFANSQGIPVARMAPVTTSLDLIKFIDEVGYPVIVKPRTGAGTCGVSKLLGPKDLTTYLARGLMTSFDGSVNLLAEEFVTGVMYHVDGLFGPDGVKVSWPHIYKNDGITVMTEGKTLGSRGLAPDDPLRARLQHFAARTLKTLPSPAVLSAFHLEVWHTADDRLILCEVASRAGGAGVNDMFREEMGIDMCAIAARSQAGLSIDSIFPEAPPIQLAGWMNLPPSRGTFVSGPISCDLPYVTAYQLLAVPGKTYLTTNDSMSALALVIFVADNISDLMAREAAIEQWFNTHIVWQDL